MKKIKFFAMALAALAIVSCSKENVNAPDGDKGGISTPTYATFTFTSGPTSAISRAAGNNETDGGKSNDANEKVIRTARLLIFNVGSGDLLETNKPITLTAGVTKISEVVKAGNKKIYVIANETAVMTTALNALKPQVTSNAVFLDMKYDAGVPGDAAFTLKPLYTLGVTPAAYGFPMSSSDNADAIRKFEPNVNETDAAKEDNPNNVKISLDYMLAKVAVVVKDATVLANSIFTITDMKFAIRNIARNTYLTQRFENGRVKGAHYDFLGTTVENWATMYHTTPVPEVAVATTTATTYVYAAENTKSTATNLEGGATYAAISCVITPKSGYDGTDMKWDPITGKLALGTAKTNFTTGDDFIVTTKQISTIPAGTVFTTVKILEGAIDLINTNSGTTPAITVTAGTDYNVHTAGAAWYRINISEMEETTTTYGVERGKRYVATINTIKGFGSSSDDLATSPETPLDQNTYIDVTVTAKGWDVANSSVDL